MGTVTPTLTPAQILAHLNGMGTSGALFDASVFALKDPSAPTKIGKFSAAGITAGQTRTYTLPDATGTVPLLGLAQSWTATQTFAGIDATSIGATTRGTGAFTTLAANGATTLTAGTASTSTTTGTLVVTGGTGISGALWIGGLANIAGATTVDLGTGTDPATALSGTVVTLRNADATNVRLVGVSYGANALIMCGRAVGGTRASPTATTAGQVMAQFTGFGYNGTSYATSSAALYAISAGSLWTLTNNETNHEWRVTANGSTTNVQRMVLYGTGNLCLGSAPTDDGTNNLQVAGSAKISSSTASTSTTTGALIVTGGVGIGGVINVANDTDGTHVIGRMKIGTFVASDSMGLAHFDLANTTDFCLNQSALGTTNFNAKSGQSCIFTIGGASKMTLNTSSLTLNTGVPLIISDTTVSTSTGTGALTVGGGAGFSGQVNATNVATRNSGAGSWTGSAFSGTDYSASDTANAPFFRAINTNAGRVRFRIPGLPIHLHRRDQTDLHARLRRHRLVDQRHREFADQRPLLRAARQRRRADRTPADHEPRQRDHRQPRRAGDQRHRRFRLHAFLCRDSDRGAYGLHGQGRVALRYDSTNHIIYIADAHDGAWKKTARD
jgi:hypothetical protein